MSNTYKNDLFKKKNLYKSPKICIVEKIRTSGNTGHWTLSQVSTEGVWAIPNENLSAVSESTALCADKHFHE